MIRETIFRGFSCGHSLSIQGICTNPLVWRFRSATIALALLAGILIAGAGPLMAQSTAIVTPVAYARGSNGMLQAGDGNFYAHSLPIFESCINSTTQLCSYIYSMTPDGTTSVFYGFKPIANSASPPIKLDGIEPTALFVCTDGALYGACMAGGPGGFGTIFKIDIPTKTLTVLKSFGITGNAVDPGNSPNSLIQAADGSFYFTNGVGIYQLTVSGTTGTVTPLYTFPIDPKTLLLTKGDGSNSLVQGSDGNLYMTMATAPTTFWLPGSLAAILGLLRRKRRGSSGTSVILLPFCFWAELGL